MRYCDFNFDTCPFCCVYGDPDKCIVYECSIPDVSQDCFFIADVLSLVLCSRDDFYNFIGSDDTFEVSMFVCNGSCIESYIRDNYIQAVHVYS